VVVLLALLPSLGTFTAPWIAEDAALLAEAERSGPWADWTRSQGGLHQVLFWRPVVSTSWALQEASTGIDPAPLRALNWVAHAATALCIGWIVRRLGGNARAALLAGGVAALFPEQGGTVTWLAGRTDVLVGLALVASVATALGRAPILGLPLAFLAVATKEFGVLALPWSVLLLFADGRGWREVARRAWPVAAGVLTACCARRLALGTWTGGYPPVAVDLAQALPRTGAGLVTAAGSWLLPALAFVAVGAWARSADRRAVIAALLCAVLAGGLLYPLLADDGYLEPQNRRLLSTAALAIALAVGTASAHPARSVAAGRVLAVSGGALLAWLCVLAWRDTHEWARAARAGEERVAAARAAVAAVEPDPRPVLADGFPATFGGAYALGFGLAERFREPFPETPRPVWPLRPIFLRGDSARRPARALRPDGTLWPLDEREVDRSLVELALTDADGVPLEELAVDERSFVAPEDRSPRLCVADGLPGATFELVVYTEVGYEPFALGTLDGAGRACASLMQLFAVTGTSASVGGTLTHAADLGARTAYLEFRALDTAGELRAASRWLELRWSSDLLDESVSAR